MVVLDRALPRALPPMAPTTRSARLSIGAQDVNYKAASSSRAITVETSMGFQEETHLKVYKAKTGNGSQRKGRIGAKKEKKASSVAAEEAVATDMEDLCSLTGLFSFSESEVVEIRTRLLSWYDSNHRVLPWRINLQSCLESPSYSGDDGDETCKEAPRVEAKKAASSAAVCQQSLSSTSL